MAGPARSGRTTALAVIEAVAGAAGWATVTVAGPRSPLGRRGDALTPGDVEASLAASMDAFDGPVLLLVDDAEHVDPDNTVMPAILARPEVTVVAAGRADVLRGLYTHWTRTVRQSRVGLLLQPDVDLDGDLLSLRLPRRSTTPIGAGRGYLCLAGEHDLVQVAQPDDPLDLARDLARTA